MLAYSLNKNIKNLKTSKEVSGGVRTIQNLFCFRKMDISRYDFPKNLFLGQKIDYFHMLMVFPKNGVDFSIVF